MRSQGRGLGMWGDVSTGSLDQVDPSESCAYREIPLGTSWAMLCDYLEELACEREVRRGRMGGSQD